MSIKIAATDRTTGRKFTIHAPRDLVDGDVFTAYPAGEIEVVDTNVSPILIDAYLVSGADVRLETCTHPGAGAPDPVADLAASMGGDGPTAGEILGLSGPRARPASAEWKPGRVLEQIKRAQAEAIKQTNMTRMAGR